MSYPNQITLNMYIIHDVRVQTTLRIVKQQTRIAEECYKGGKSDFSQK